MEIQFILFSKKGWVEVNLLIKGQIIQKRLKLTKRFSFRKYVKCSEKVRFKKKLFI